MGTLDKTWDQLKTRLKKYSMTEHCGIRHRILHMRVCGQSVDFMVCKHIHLNDKTLKRANKNTLTHIKNLLITKIHIEKLQLYKCNVYAW